MNKTSTCAYQTDDLELFKALSKRPEVAWPSIVVLVAAFVCYGISITGYIEGTLSLPWAIVISTIGAYLSFTPGHDATHNSISTNRQLNDWIGRIATVLQSPVPFFRTFRFIHMQHHRFTNDETKDPDVYVSRGSRWLLPLRWATLDINYLFYYFRPSVFKTRPESERKELYLAILFGTVILIVVGLAGWVEYYVLLFFIPTRINTVLLSVVFDYLPHYPHHKQEVENPFQATSNRVGLEWLLTPLLLFQNYHLVHHLYPKVPFYRYLKVWNARIRYHQSQNPATTDALSLHPRNAG
jgi:fatty acid desaturase